MYVGLQTHVGHTSTEYAANVRHRIGSIRNTGNGRPNESPRPCSGDGNPDDDIHQVIILHRELSAVQYSKT
jgi:hypothetical protein